MSAQCLSVSQSKRGEMKALALAALFLSLSALAFASDCYIAADGTDSGTCTSATNPCLTFNYVSSQGIGKSSEPGSVVADEVT